MNAAIRILFLLAAVGSVALATYEGISQDPVFASVQQSPYSFSHPPFVHPKIIQDLSTVISDTGDQITGINLLDSQGSNRYAGDILVQEVRGGFPFVCVAEKEPDGLGGATFGYRYIGKTTSGIHVLRTSDSGLGSGVFVNLLLMTIRQERGVTWDWESGSVRPGEERVVLHKLGEIDLGDRWDGDLRVEGNRVFVGKDHGWFSTSGGLGGGWLSSHPKDRYLSIELDSPSETPGTGVGSRD